MAKRGRKVTFHGAFGTKEKAERKHKRIPGSYIQKIKVRGDIRYAVITRRRYGAGPWFRLR